MSRNQDDWRSRAIVRAIRDLQEERARLERIAVRLVYGEKHHPPTSMQGVRSGSAGLARTTVWAGALVISVGTLAYTARDLMELGVFEPRASTAIAASGTPEAIGRPSSTPALPVPAAGPAMPVQPSPLMAAAPSIASAQPAPAPRQAASAEDMLALGQVLTGVRPSPVAGAEPRGIVYFDPRCPYCHAAWTDLASKGVDLLWLPVTALGREAPNASLVAAVLGRAGEGKTVLEAAFGPAPPAAEMSADLQAKSEENTAGFLALARGWPQEIEGVPAFVIRGQDGKVKIGSGWPPPAGLLD